MCSASRSFINALFKHKALVRPSTALFKRCKIFNSKYNTGSHNSHPCSFYWYSCANRPDYRAHKCTSWDTGRYISDNPVRGWHHPIKRERCSGAHHYRMNRMAISCKRAKEQITMSGMVIALNDVL